MSSLQHVTENYRFQAHFDRCIHKLRHQLRGPWHDRNRLIFHIPCKDPDSYQDVQKLVDLWILHFTALHDDVICYRPSQDERDEPNRVIGLIDLQQNQHDALLETIDALLENAYGALQDSPWGRQICDHYAL